MQEEENFQEKKEESSSKEKNLVKDKNSIELRDFIVKNYKKLSKEELKKESLSRGITEKDFENIYKSLEEKNKNPREIKKDGKEFLLLPVEKEAVKEALKSPSPYSFFRPTQVTTYAFCLILVIAVGYSIATSFSFSSFSYSGESVVYGEKSSSFKIGYPLAFIEVNASANDPFKFFLFNFLGDFILYFLLAYVIDLIFTNSIRAILEYLEKEKDYFD